MQNEMEKRIYGIPTKFCSTEGCTQKVWSKGLCKSHWSAEHSLGLRRTSLTPRSVSDDTNIPPEKKVVLRSRKPLLKRSPNRKLNDDYGFTDQVSLFNHIWDTREHKSQVSGRVIHIQKASDYWYSCFAHLLAKSAYPRYYLNPDNIWLLLPIEHQLVDQGTLGERKKYEQLWNCSFNKFYDLQRKLRKQYERGE